MNPQLVYIITKQRIAEFHRESRVRRLSVSLHCDVTDRFAGATDAAASMAEGGQPR